MTIAYCTNIWNHHQGPVCQELARLLGENNFKMLLHQPLDHKFSLQRMAIGWNLIPPSEPWIVGPPKSVSSADYTEYKRIASEVDVLIYNSDVPYLSQEDLVMRHRAGKINMRMGERLYRKMRPWYYTIWPRKQIARWIVHHRFESAGVHFLTMGHWCAQDLNYLHACKGRIWRWGYLTRTSAACAPKKPISGRKVRIGWCGRMLQLKQVDYIIRAYALMPEELRAKSEVVLVGNGEAEESLRKLASALRVEKSIAFIPIKPQSEAIEFLKGLDIFVFPSDRSEGWGATLLEAMDSGCAVIANESAGATLDVIEDGVNGITFKQGQMDKLTKALSLLVRDDLLRINMGQKAWSSMQKWSPKVGAQRLIQLSRFLLRADGDQLPNTGLCSAVRS